MKYLLIALLLTSCSDKSIQATVTAINGMSTYTVTRPLEPGDCANGGVKYVTYADKNANGTVDSEELAAATQSVICNGLNGTNGLDGFQKGTSCRVYDVSSWGVSSTLPVLLTGAVPKFDLIIDQFDVPRLYDAATNTAPFPKFTAAQQALVGLGTYVLDCDGYINIPKTQTYTFTSYSDDNSVLYIDNQPLISMDNLQAPTARSASVFLTKGRHKINFTYFQAWGALALSLYWQAPEFAQTIVPSSVLSY